VENIPEESEDSFQFGETSQNLDQSVMQSKFDWEKSNDEAFNKTDDVRDDEIFDMVDQSHDDIS